MSRLIFFILFLGLFFSKTALASPPDSLQNLEAFLSKNELTPDKTRSGLLFKIEKTGEGNAIRPGQFVKVHYTGRLLDGRVFDATRDAENDEPFVFQTGFRQVVAGLEEGIGLLKPGGKATFYLPAKLAYGNTAVGSTIPAGAALIYEVELLEVMTSAAYDEWSKEQEIREREAFQKKEKLQFEADQKLLDNYQKDKKLAAAKLPSGLRFLISKPGKGPKPVVGQTISVEYEGFLLNGSRFDTSETATPFEFKIGHEEVIAGWDEGLLQFNAGAEGWLLIPSKLAYGPMSIEEGETNIPANSPLIFRVRIVEIR